MNLEEVAQIPEEENIRVGKLFKELGFKKGEVRAYCLGYADGMIYDDRRNCEDRRRENCCEEDRSYRPSNC